MSQIERKGRAGHTVHENRASVRNSNTEVLVRAAQPARGRSQQQQVKASVNGSSGPCGQYGGRGNEDDVTGLRQRDRRKRQARGGKAGRQVRGRGGNSGPCERQGSLHATRERSSETFETRLERWSMRQGTERRQPHPSSPASRMLFLVNTSFHEVARRARSPRATPVGARPPGERPVTAAPRPASPPSSASPRSCNPIPSGRRKAAEKSGDSRINVGREQGICIPKAEGKAAAGRL